MDCVSSVSISVTPVRISPRLLLVRFHLTPVRRSSGRGVAEERREIRTGKEPNETRYSLEPRHYDRRRSTKKPVKSIRNSMEGSDSLGILTQVTSLSRRSFTRVLWSLRSYRKPLRYATLIILPYPFRPLRGGFARNGREEDDVERA